MNYEATIERSEAFSISKIFGWLFLALGITAVSSYGFAFLLLSGLIPADIYLYVMFGAVVLVVIETFVIQFRLLRNNKSLVAPFVVYALSMGLMLSTLVALINPVFIAMAFGITAVLFGVMALYGYLTKRNLNAMAGLAISLLLGALIISLINWLIGSETIDWIVSFVSFGAIMLFVSVDMWRIKKIADSGRGTNNLCLYCAFQLYVDFIYIFMRIIGFLARIYNKR